MVYSKEYIPTDYLHNLKTYQYKSIDKSPLSNYVLNHYWEYLVTFVPLWVAPNMITLLGSLHIVGAYILNMIYAPNLNKTMPSWVYLVQGSCLWIYGSLDAIDGKQARRTGQSGPLGELFDHGCDSLTTGLALTMTATAMGLGCGWKTVVFFFIGYINFYTSTLEEYHTGILYTGYFSGAVEGIVISSLSLITTGILGNGIWKIPLFDKIAFMKPIIESTNISALKEFNMVDFYLSFMVIGIFPTVYASYRHIKRSKAALNKSTNQAVKDMIPLIAYLGPASLWLYNSPSVLAPFPTLNRMHIPMFIGVVNSYIINSDLQKYFSGVDEVALLWICLSVSFIQYSHFALSVISVICNYMDIYCLTIKHKKVL
ncbi:hypothetical protein BB559_003357 [Furculomyces boomerangus]|uniref:Uncharacterized protein n=2 Tax=Harpellales TaxID=61421 RepID=A0A2T9YLN6_9FUNG|nr:hypothetical protein BB559_003357 [Furculomyces boomerangus]PWA00415.1 hypothetical protein BB558_003512 [Smittium angustum]